MSTLEQANFGATDLDLDLDLDTLARGADAATAGTTRAGKPAAGAARAGKLAAAEVVTPAVLDLAEKLELEDALFDLHRRIFRDLDRARFVRIVVDSTAEHHWIQLYRDEHGALGGYAGFEAGNGLLALAPLTLGTVARGLARNLRARSTRSVRRLLGRTRAGIAGLLPERADS